MRDRWAKTALLIMVLLGTLATAVGATQTLYDPWVPMASMPTQKSQAPQLVQQPQGDMALGTEALSLEDKPEAVETETFLVGVQNLESPFSRTEADGSLGGISVDFLAFLAQYGELELEIVEITDETQDYDYDFTLLMEESDAHGLVESVPFCTVPLMYVEHVEGSGDVATIGVLDCYGLTAEMIQETLSTDYEVKGYGDLNDMREAFDGGKLASMVITTTSLTYISDALETDYYLSTPVDLEVELAVCFSDGLSQEVQDYINWVIGEIPAAELQMSRLTNAMPVSQDSTLVVMARDYPEVFLIPIVLALVVLLWLGYRNGKKLKQIANVDDLTGVHSANHFRALVRKRLKENPGERYVMMSLDIDDFKHINEIYGYTLGNQVISILANKITSLGGKDIIVARTFADKFLIFDKKENFVDYSSVDEDVHRSTFENLVGEDYTLTLSVGVYDVVDHATEVEYMIDCADLCRGMGKGISQTTVIPFTEDLVETRSFISGLVAGTEHALATKEFKAYYQPKVDLATGKICGAEVLVRWMKGEQFIPPVDFIPIFEQNGVIQKLDYYMIDHVCEFLKNNPEAELYPISVNISGATIVKPTVVEDLMEIVERHGVSPSQLDLEMTETALVEAHESALSALSTLREKGFTVSMDDFGVGLSSLTRLKDIPIDTLKIDRGLVLGHMENEKGASILRNIFSLAEDLKVKTVAEGIEAEEHLRFLISYGCHIGQGYYFSRPVPEQEFLEIYQKSNRKDWVVPK